MRKHTFILNMLGYVKKMPFKLKSNKKRINHLIISITLEEQSTVKGEKRRNILIMYLVFFFIFYRIKANNSSSGSRKKFRIQPDTDSQHWLYTVYTGHNRSHMYVQCTWYIVVKFVNSE